MLFSDALPLRAGAAGSFAGWVVTAGFEADFATGLAACFDAEAAAGGGAFLGVLRCKAVRTTLLELRVGCYTLM